MKRPCLCDDIKNQKSEPNAERIFCVTYFV